MPRSRQTLSGLAILIAAAMAACGDSVLTAADPPQDGPSLAFVAGGADCTFGAGYWKTHPSAWPARFDPEAAFYRSGKSWLEVLRTPPRGDAYYILAHQFIATALNLESLDPGLRPTEIGTPFAVAGSGYFTDGAHSDFLRPRLLDLAALFESFNEGNRGVRSCD